LRLSDVVCSDIEWALVSNMSMDVMGVLTVLPALLDARHVQLVAHDLSGKNL